MARIKGGDVLITGGSGFIGSYVTEALKNKYDVVVADTSKPKIRGVRFQKIDLKKPFSISGDFKKCIHLAGLVGGIQYFTKHPVENIRDNPRMTANVFDACVNGGVDHIVYASSSVVYQHQQKFPTIEDDVSRAPPPTSAYGISKLIGEYFCRFYNEQFGLGYTVLRPVNAYGPGEAPDPDYAHVIPHLIKKVLDGQYPVEIYGRGDQIRTFTHVYDIASAFKACMEKTAARNQFFNVCGNKPLKIMDVLERIWRLTGHKNRLRIKHVKAFKDDIQRRHPSNKKIRRMLGWKPEITFNAGLKDTISWIQANQF